MKKQTIQLLIIEDSPEWAIKLLKMYEEVFQETDIKLEMYLEISGNKALERLNRESFDLISLDINLSNNHPLTQNNQIDLEIRGADGRDILLYAHENKSCKGVIVITGLQQDENLDVVIPDEEEREEVRMELDLFLEELFPGRRNLYLHKLLHRSPEYCIKSYQKKLTYEKLLKLVDDPSSLLPPYSIRTFESRCFVEIRSLSNPARESVTLRKKKYIQLFYLMIDRGFNSVCYEDVQAICRPRSRSTDVQKVAHTCIQNFRRYLESQELDPDALFMSDPEFGWKLLPDIHIINARRPRG